MRRFLFDPRAPGGRGGPLPVHDNRSPTRGAADQRTLSQSSGASITPAYEGWFTNADGTHTFLIGYLNRNTAQTIEVPIGANNRFEPGGPDMGQPTVFLPGRQVGVVHHHGAEGLRREAAADLVDHGQRRDQQHPVLAERAVRSEPVVGRRRRQQPAGDSFRPDRSDHPGADRRDRQGHPAHRDGGRGSLAAGVGDGRCEVFERIECAAAQSPAAGDPALVEVSRARRR